MSVAAIICLLIAALALISAVVWAGEWYGFFSLLVCVGFAVTGVIVIWQESR